MEEDILYMAHMTTYTDLAVRVFCRTTMAATFCIIIMACIFALTHVTLLMDGIVPTYVSYIDEDKRLGWNYIDYVNGWPVLVY
jgi:hypothetical protein